MKLLQLSILIATNTIANASPNEHDGNITQLDDGVCFEEVAENFYRNSGVVDIRSFLRGASAFNSSENLNDLIDFQKFYYEHDDEDDDDNDEPLDIVDDEEDDEDIDSTIVDEIDDGSGRRLQTTPEKVLKTMNNRDKKWLSSHNSRRKMYHNKYGSSYSPLMWSHKLKKKVSLASVIRMLIQKSNLAPHTLCLSCSFGPQAKKWAKHLASLCGSRGIYHDPGKKRLLFLLDFNIVQLIQSLNAYDS